MPFTYGDIPDSEEKPYLPIMHNIWKLFQELGWNPLLKIFEDLSYNVYKIGYERMKSTVDTAKLVMEEKIDGTKVVNYSLSPPFYTIRNDLQAGSMKLLYGESFDSTYVVSNTFDDTNRQIGFLMNCHLEDGFPVDFWTVSHDDDLLDRRHIKLGIKLRDLPARAKNYDDIGWKAREILLDVRNERTPQWTDSPYFTGACRLTGVLNCLLELSNYELFYHVYNNYNTKRVYRMKDLIFSVTPFPQLLYSGIFMDPAPFILRIIGLTTGLNWVIQGFHERNIQYLKEQFSEMWYIILTRAWERDGIPTPQVSLDWQYPNLKERKDFTKKFTRVSTKNTRITLDDLNIDLEDAYRGVFLDYTFEDPPETLSHDSIISIGMGKEAQVLQENSEVNS